VPESHPRGKFSLTEVRVLASSGSHALVELNLVSGRPHQLRLHMSNAGLPIVGDPYYNRYYIRQLQSHADPYNVDHRMKLQAYSLQLPDVFGSSLHPEPITLKLPLPSDWAEDFPLLVAHS